MKFVKKLINTLIFKKMFEKLDTFKEIKYLMDKINDRNNIIVKGFIININAVNLPEIDEKSIKNIGISIIIVIVPGKIKSTIFSIAASLSQLIISGFVFIPVSIC